MNSLKFLMLGFLFVVSCEESTERIGAKDPFGHAQPSERNPEQIRELKKRFDSGEIEVAVDLWNQKDTILNSADLNQDIPAAELVKMINVAADAGIPEAQALRFWHSIESDSGPVGRSEIADLETAFSHGEVEEGGVLSLILALHLNEHERAKEVALKYFEEGEFEVVPSEQEKEKFIMLVSGAALSEIDPANTFTSQPLASVWNTWFFVVKDRLREQ